MSFIEFKFTLKTIIITIKYFNFRIYFNYHEKHYLMKFDFNFVKDFNFHFHFIYLVKNLN